MPAAPQPATDRPIMKAIELGAVAQMIEPASNIASALRNTVLVEKSVYSRPNTSWNAQNVMLYAEPYHCLLHSEVSTRHTGKTLSIDQG